MGAFLVKNLKAADSSAGVADISVENDDDSIDLHSPACVKQVHIDGVCKTKSKLITRQLEHLFDARTFEAVLQEAQLGKLRLERLGVFSGIEVFLDVSRGPDAGPDDIDVYYRVRELRQLSANVGTNVGNNEGHMTLGGRINNLRGLGETLRLDTSFGSRSSSSYEFLIAKPIFYDPDKKFTFRVLKSTSDLPQSCYRETARGVGAALTLPTFIGLHTIGWEGTWRENTVSGSNIPLKIREHCGHTLKSSLKHTLVSDGRDDWVFPSRGHYFKHNVEYAGIGGNIRALKTDVDLQVNMEILQGVVLAGGVQAGFAKSLGRDGLAINDRYFLGGPLSVRGFGMRGIGLHADAAALGGEVFWAGGLHLYTPLPFRPTIGGFGEYFRLHFFANAGNLSDLSYCRNREFFSRGRWSYGAGIMFMLGGMARLEVNYCVPKNAQPGDILSEGLQVGVGLNFL